KERLENICGITYPQIFVKKLLTFTGTTKIGVTRCVLNFRDFWHFQSSTAEPMALTITPLPN
ncbi:MAG: hypothetical protein JW883_03720, partial [Deltaproteobacteria bacterium]|nr:hypothetical protein [Deltaproteobacteria bacterium]